MQPTDLAMALTHGQMAKALRLGEVAVLEVDRGADGRPTVAADPARARVRRLGTTITAGMLVAGALTAARATENPHETRESGRSAASGMAARGSIPRLAAAAPGRDRAHASAARANQVQAAASSQEQSKMLSKFTGVAAATAVGVSATVAGAQSAAVQWRVEDGGNGHWYAVIPATTFDTASARAAELGGYLATSTSAAENARLVERLVTTSASRAHLGLVQLDNQAAVDAGWGWVTGEPITFSNWRCFGGEIRCAPDDTPCGVRPFRVENNQANCGALERNGDWDDLEKGAWCDNGTRVAIVEWSADCNNDGIVDYGQCQDGTLPDYNGNNVPDCCERGEACVVANYPVQWRVEDGGNGHWYRLTVDRVQWAQARQAATLRGGELASIGSSDENDFVFRVGRSAWIGGWAGPWIGGMRTATGWEWSDGSPWTFTAWDCVNPSNTGGSEDWVHFAINGLCSLTPMATWNDAFSGRIGSGGLAFVTEWSADCNNDGIVDYGQILDGTFTDANSNGIPDSCDCLGDIDDDGWIDGVDLGGVLAAWGKAPAGTPADLNGDGAVDGTDLGVLLAGWGACAP
jgi:hypothetical protein